MPSTSWTQGDLTALEASLKLGATKVKYADKEIEYRSLSDMIRLRDLMRRELGLVGRGGTTFTPYFSKGLD